MINKVLVFALFTSFCHGQQTVSCSVIDSLVVPPPDSVLMHALSHSPLLFDDQARLDLFEHAASKWGFLASLVPSPSYSFTGLDHGWRLSFSVGSFVTALKGYASSRGRIQDLSRQLGHQKESLVFMIMQAYSNFERSMLDLEAYESALKSEQKRHEVYKALFSAGKLTDIEIINADLSIENAQNSCKLKRLEARSKCLDIYRIGGYRVKMPIFYPLSGIQRVSEGLYGP